ncbi:putative nuclear pore complex protein Nup160 [Lucilia cuprina]|uniref:Putative nuclear pore complex protein Nup160 n=1 Tax=Lucilia cuprina TaxID=7375 RepID=A0A0L0C9P9_LUCCU|nr:putative nuclear pore complex protein Nup160 [Lucilia cuprina]
MTDVTQSGCSGTHSTLQDIKVAEKAGGYCYKKVSLNHNRNRYIYWRIYQDILELSEISLDFNLYQNNLRYKFTDSPVIAVNIIEQGKNIVLLVCTVCSLHRICFPHPDSLAEGLFGGNVGANSTTVDFNDSQSFSIFKDANAAAARDPNSFYVIDNLGPANSHIPHAAASFLSSNGEEAYFALACQNQLMLYTMNCSTGHTIGHQLKEHHIMPRLFSNIKGALTGKTDTSDADHANSLVFTCINNQILLLALYRNDHLRVWSTINMQITCAINCVREGNEQRMQGPQSNALRKINDISFCAFLSHSTGSEFVCIDLQIDAGNSSGLSLQRRKIISAPQLDLTDFDVCDSRIWALWSNAEGEFSISSFSLVRGMGINWVSAAMEPPPDRYCLGIEQGMDPREAYCSYIFHPGKFERSVIAKALFMFRRSNVRFEGKHCTMTLLKEHVCQAIEDELQNEVKDFDVSDDDYLEISTRLWERFYSCCEQYHMKASQPSGLLILEPLDAVCVVKKNTFSLLRPCETIEHLMLAGEDVEADIVVPLHFPDNEREGRDLVNVVEILAQIEKWLPEDVKIDIDRKLYQLEMPNVVIEKLTEDLLAGDTEKELLPSNFLVAIRQKMQSIKDLRTAMSMLLDILRMDNGNPETMHTNFNNLNHTTRAFMSLGVLFGSQVGLSLLAETVRQNALIRFAICRNLLLLQQILIDTHSLPVDILECLRSQFMPDVLIFLQSYYVMVWISETPVNINAAAAMETSMQRLNLLQLTSGSGRIYSNGGKCSSAPLLQVFLNAKGLYTALSLYADNFKELDNVSWQNTLMPLSTTVSQLIWAVSFNFVFGEWLFSTCQHIIIADYVRLLNSWCEWNICSRQFILAVTLLDSGESHKAYDLFLQSAKGVVKEQFLAEKILKNTPYASLVENLSVIETDKFQLKVTNQCIAQYYLKVIQLFEQHNALDHIISMAQVAIGLLDKNDPQLPMFQSIVFNNHLQLEHYEEAYHSLIYNAELSRRKDCLRQLVITLFNRKRYDLLMHFPYVGLHEEFENIVESRARSQSMDKNEIYDFLYAFHVNNGNMRKASAIMYEQSMRYQLEGDSLESLNKRFSSLLVCLNCLHLIDERYRWIAKPVIGDEYDVSNTSKDGMHEDDDDDKRSDDQTLITKTQVVVLEIKHIKMEMLHTEALIKLSEHRKDIHSFLNAGPQELSMVLASCGLFTAALKLAKGFATSVLPIFDSLAAACVRTADENPTDAWDWLQENDLADLPHRNKASDMAWSLLRKLVEDNEEESSTQIRKSVVNKLLSLQAFIPQWLHNNYKLSNCSELLHLYVRHNRLLEAAELAQEMLSAMLGAGSEYFSFKHSIAVTNPELTLPLNSIDLLLHGLKLNGEDIEYRQAHAELEDKLHKYIETATRTAQDKIEMSFQINRERQQLWKS